MRPYLFLLRRLGLRSMRAHPARTALTVAGVAIGVGVFLAIRLANQGTLAGFRNTFNAVAGRAALEITSQGEPFGEGVFAVVREVPGVRAAAPLLQVMAAAEPGPEETPDGGPASPPTRTDPPAPGPDRPPGVPLWVLGIDILSERTFRDYEMAPARGSDKGNGLESALQRLLAPDTLFVTDRFAARHGIGVGDPLRLVGPAGPRRLTVRGLIRAAEGGAGSPASALDGNIALMDIAAAQEAFGRIGQLDRIDLLPAAGIELETLAERVRGVLPGDLTVGRPARRSRQAERLLDAFQLNLTVLSYISLLVGVFIIYNAMSITVVRRRREWGVLRSLGVSGRGIVAMVLAEAAVLGLLGSGIGVGLGIGLGRGALEAVGRTVGNLYGPVSAARIHLSLPEAAMSLVVGTAVSLFSSWIPALSAARMGVRESLHRGAVSPVRPRRRKGFTALGILLFCAAAVLVRLGPVRGAPLFGYLAALCVVLGTSFLTPLLIGGFSLFYRRWRGRTGRPEDYLVDLSRAAGKNSVAIASLAVAVAMLVSVSLMVASFRSTMETWIRHTLRADLYVTPVVRFIGNQGAVLPSDAAEIARATEGVLAVDAFRSRRITFRGWRVRLGAGTLPVVRDHGGMSFLSGDRHDILTRALLQGEVLVSEVFSNRFGLGRGDTFSLDTASGPRRFRIAGVFYDYSTEGGLVVLDRTLYRDLWRDDRVSTLALYLQPGADLDRVKESLHAAFGSGSGVAAFENRRLRRHVLNVFDQTFSITYALEAIALAVAILGILKALLTNVLDRTREIGLLRTIGFDRRQIAGWVMREAAAMGMIANLLGFASGWLLALILIFVINKQSFGWTIQPHWPPPLLAGYLVLTVAAAAAAALWPARVAANVEIQEAIRFE